MEPALERDVAATLLALAGVRAGDTVVAVGDALLARSAAAAAGPDGRVVGLDAEAGTVHRVIDGVVGRDTDAALAAYARVLRPGGRLVLVARDDPAAVLQAAGFAVVHATPGAIHYVAAVRT